MTERTPPRLFTTADAATYLGYKTTSGIRYAVRRGELVPFGAGPRNTHLFTREQLDEFARRRRDSTRTRLARLRGVSNGTPQGNNQGGPGPSIASE